MPGTLYIVATPIGNREDLTIRALKILNGVDLIAAEDTRTSRRLLDYYYIDKEMTSYHEFNKEKKTPFIIQRLMAGDSVALITDAGTPGISDPAYVLVKEARKKKLPVIPVGGISAITSLLSVSGLTIDSFTFYGFIPRKKTKQDELFFTIKERSEAAIVFEVPHRLGKTLSSMAEILGDRNVVVGREITKLHESITAGPASTLPHLFENQTIKGEITIIIEGKARRKKAARRDKYAHLKNNHHNDEGQCDS